MTVSRLNPSQQRESLWSLGGLTWPQLTRRAWQGISKTDIFDRAYELAYNFLLAVFPMFLFLFSLCGLFVRESSSLRLDLLAYLQLAVPPIAYQLLHHTLEEITRNPQAGKLTFGILLALFSGSAGTTQLISTLNGAYEVRETRSWVKVHLISLGLTIAISILIVTALLLLLLGGEAIAYLGQILSMGTIALFAAKLLQWAFALGFVVLAFALVYYFAPDVHEQHWYWITPGSVFGLNATIEHAAAEHGHVEAKAPGQKAA
jgi:membrane protein